MVNAITVAQYFLSQVDENAGDAITNLKLQKLLYYAQGFHLAVFGEPLFDKPIEAWVHGPVVDSVYQEFKQHGNGPIPCDDDLDWSTFPRDSQELLDDVYCVYGQFSAWKLRDMTHDEPPWKDTGRGLEITHESLKKHFLTQIENDQS